MCTSPSLHHVFNIVRVWRGANPSKTHILTTALIVFAECP